jgi:hypothetical protein
MRETAPGASLPLSRATWSAKAFLTAYRLRDASLRQRWKPLNSANAFRSDLQCRLDQRDLRRHAQRIIPLIPRSVGDIASAQPMQC